MSCGDTTPSHVTVSQISKGTRDRLAPVRSVASLAALAADMAGAGRAVAELLRGLDVGHDARRDILQLVGGRGAGGFP